MPGMMKIAWRRGFKHGAKGKRKLGHSTFAKASAVAKAFADELAVKPADKLVLVIGIGNTTTLATIPHTVLSIMKAGFFHFAYLHRRGERISTGKMPVVPVCAVLPMRASSPVRASDLPCTSKRDDTLPVLAMALRNYRCGNEM